MKTWLWILLIVGALAILWWLLAFVVGSLSYIFGAILVLGMIYAAFRLFWPASRNIKAPKAERKIEKAAVRELKALEKQQERQTLGRKE